MTQKELIDLFDSKGETRALPIFNYVSEHYPTFNHPKIDLGNEIFKALTRAEKVEELLGLHRAKDNVIEKYTKNSFAYFSELERLSYEIKALEKELEEMK